MSETKAEARQPRPAAATQAFDLAVARHRAGRLDEAEQLYRAVLKIEPDHFGALHHLGIAATQQGKLEEAEALLRRAVAVDPNSAEALTNLGVALMRLRREIGDFEAAVATCHRFGRRAALAGRDRRDDRRAGAADRHQLSRPARRAGADRATDHRQDADEFPLCRPDPSGAAERAHHPCAAAAGRHLSVLLLQTVRRRSACDRSDKACRSEAASGGLKATGAATS